jgi:hypothetical protein
MGLEVYTAEPAKHPCLPLSSVWAVGEKRKEIESKRVRE